MNLPPSSETVVASGGQRRPKMRDPLSGPHSASSAYRRRTFGRGSGQRAVFVGLTSSDCLNRPDILAFSHTWMEIGECKGFVTVNTFTKSRTLERWGLKRPAQVSAASE